jgi:hypothetical protein
MSTTSVWGGAKLSYLKPLIKNINNSPEAHWSLQTAYPKPPEKFKHIEI